jgi:DNA segregation ATPase FtsK/SpoIIIE, S-DNA-T family
VRSALVREAGLIAMLGLAAFMLLAMISYSPNDPAWSFRGTGLEVTNLVGRSGAWCADLLFSLFGVLAYVLPAALMLAAVRVFRMRAWLWPLVFVRSTGWLVSIVAGAVLVRIHVAADVALPAGASGMLGAWLVQTGMPLFNWIGLTLIALVGLTLGSQAALGFSWIGVAETTGRFIYRATGFVTQSIDRYYDLVMSRRYRRAEAKTLLAHRRAAVATENSLKKTRKPPAIQPPTMPARISQKAMQKPLFQPTGAGELPDFDLMDNVPPDPDAGYSEESLSAMSRLLELKLRDFGVEAEVVSVLPGPVITRFEIQPAPGVKVSRITSLVKDLARSLAVISVRIVEVIPGKSVVGIEIPNENRSIVSLRELITSDVYQRSKSPLALALGKDIGGVPVVVDVTRMPHLLVAGTTGSGKSVGVNAMLLSILYKSTPEEVRLILVDPKMLELSVYEGIPHLLTPVVTDMKEAAQALQWCVGEMERRYRLMAALGVRNLAGYNRKVKDAQAADEPIRDPLWARDAEEPAPELTTLPLITVVIDEFADMMMVVGKKVEQLIARIAQKARAAGIHLILATQRPSVDVITGLIKANIPSRISFQVSSKVDSRTILDQGGAEQLLGHGDMLYLPPGSPLPTRVHGAFVSDDEVHRIVADWKERGEPNYQIEVLAGSVEYVDPVFGGEGNGSAEQDDTLYDEAVAFVLESRRASISAVQRKLRVGYNRAARLIEAMEEAGVVSPMNSNGSREVLVPNRD